jgi:hypothetical protein
MRNLSDFFEKTGTYHRMTSNEQRVVDRRNNNCNPQSKSGNPKKTNY